MVDVPCARLSPKVMVFAPTRVMSIVWLPLPVMVAVPLPSACTASRSPVTVMFWAAPLLLRISASPALSAATFTSTVPALMFCSPAVVLMICAVRPMAAVTPTDWACRSCPVPEEMRALPASGDDAFTSIAPLVALTVTVPPLTISPPPLTRTSRPAVTETLSAAVVGVRPMRAAEVPEVPTITSRPASMRMV